MERSLHFCGGMVLLSLALLPAMVRADAPGEEFFETKIRPVLVEQCYKCHSSTAAKLKGNLKLDSREGILKGGDVGPAVVPGKLEESELITALRWEEGGLQMPPKAKLPAETIGLFEQWVKMGAPMPKVSAATTQTAAKVHAMSIEEGRDFWSFQRPREQVVPSTSDGGWAKNEIDRFIFAKLAEKKLTPSRQADRRTLIRRATFDLIGLPPTAGEVEAFEKDASPGAYEKLIDRLLASPQYGERWGRYWLDVARYADTKGYVFEEERKYPFSYTYRDWVVKALNEDLPYDQFLIYQMAADRIAPATQPVATAATAPATAPAVKGARTRDSAARADLAAMGFLTLGRRFLNNQPDIIDDRIDVVCRGTMALTVSCARCHDHKYDPIPTADYYSLYGVFASSREPAELPVIDAMLPAKVNEYEAELTKRKKELEDFTAKRYGEMLMQIRSKQQLAKYLLLAQKRVTPVPVGDEFEVPDDAGMLNPWLSRRWEAYLKAKVAAKDAVFEPWRRFAALSTKHFEVKSAELVKELTAKPGEKNALLAKHLLGGAAPKSLQEVAERYAAALVEADGEQAKPEKDVEALRLVLRGEDAPTNVKIEDAKFIFGNVDRMKRRQLKNKIDELTGSHPGSPERAMAMEDLPAPVEPHVFKRGNAGNVGEAVPRQFLAVLSAEKRKPFTQGSGRLEMARAIASRENPLTARVMVNRVWMYHFGKGLVRTPSDFGTRGERPTHPELLDWLALRFIDDGWSIKKLHKRMMMSAAYQQSSVNGNSTAAQVDPENRLLWRMNPRRLDFEAMRDSLLASSGELDLTMGGRAVDIFAKPFVPRRSIYAFIDRQNLPGTFRTFDLASPDATSAQRFQTSVPQQALFMMNSAFVLEQAKTVAAKSSGADAKARVNSLYRAVLGRSPNARELELAAGFVKSEEAQKPEALATSESAWKYGVGEVDESTGKLKKFAPLAHFTGTEWQGGEKLPDAKTGWALLNATGGHPGESQFAVVRRWVAPEDCVVSVSGSLSHAPKQGNGVRGRIVTEKDGMLATWVVQRREVKTDVTAVEVKKGQAVDFIVDCRGDVTYDQFDWKIAISKEPPANAVAGAEKVARWDSEKDFGGTPAKPAAPLDAWEKLAQVLLESNEFMFVD
ncbi:MAG TPA: PSD1 and planctomycete cytochrome C domain-containing protein [Tepidisphaeraceae bacterium]